MDYEAHLRACNLLSAVENLYLAHPDGPGNQADQDNCYRTGKLLIDDLSNETNGIIKKHENFEFATNDNLTVSQLMKKNR